jgi:hypothetical protein
MVKSVGSQIVYELDHRKPVLYVVPHFPSRISWGNFLFKWSQSVTGKVYANVYLGGP